MAWLTEVIRADGTPLAQAPAHGLRFTHATGQAGGCSFTAPSIEAAGVPGLDTPGGVDILITRDAAPMWRGPLEGIDDEVTATTGGASFTCTGVAALLDLRVIPAGTEILATEQAQIAWQLIQIAQAGAGGDLGIVAGALPDSVARSRTFDTPSRVLTELQSLAGLEDGIRWRLDPTHTGHVFECWWPGATPPAPVVVWEWGRNIQSARVTLDATQARTVVTAVGRNQVGVQVEDPALITSWRRREDTLTTQDADDATYLGDLARGALRGPARTLRLTLTPGAPDATALAARPGDRAAVSILTDRIRTDGIWTVDQVDVEVPDDGGPERVAVALVDGVLT